MSNEKKNEYTDLFDGIEDEAQFKEFLQKFRTSELLNMKYPDWIYDSYCDVLEEHMFSKLGLYEYTNIRKAVLSDWDDKNSLQTKVAKLEEYNIELLKLINTLNKRNSAIIRIMSKMDSKLNVAEVLELMEDEPAK